MKTVDADEKVHSPCVNACALDNNDLCLGCYRSVDEIMLWTQMNNEERRDVLRKAAERATKAAT
jgi:predicted Fe-S protein YdhL (DUF1289 family)